MASQYSVPPVTDIDTMSRQELIWLIRDLRLTITAVTTERDDVRHRLASAETHIRILEKALTSWA